jgi:predicted RNase H-like nuclease (RuvC/YqgF family)
MKNKLDLPDNIQFMAHSGIIGTDVTENIKALFQVVKELSESYPQLVTRINKLEKKHEDLSMRTTNLQNEVGNYCDKAISQTELDNKADEICKDVADELQRALDWFKE